MLSICIKLLSKKSQEARENLLEIFQDFKTKLKDFPKQQNMQRFLKDVATLYNLLSLNTMQFTA